MISNFLKHQEKQASYYFLDPTILGSNYFWDINILNLLKYPSFPFKLFYSNITKKSLHVARIILTICQKVQDFQFFLFYL